MANENKKKLQFWELKENVPEWIEAVKTLGYLNRHDWFRDMRRQTIERAKLKKECDEKIKAIDHLLKE